MKQRGRPAFPDVWSPVHIREYAKSFLPQPDYSDDIVAVFFKCFRQRVAHHSIASAVWFDDNPNGAYRRITWKITEFDEHPPVQILHEPMRLRTALQVERSKLVSEGHKWGALKAEIESQPEKFDVMPLVDEYLQCLRSLCFYAIHMEGEHRQPIGSNRRGAIARFTPPHG